jgi:hypothetical protein
MSELYVICDMLYVICDISCAHYVDILFDNEIEVVVPSKIICWRFNLKPKMIRLFVRTPSDK